MDAPVEKIAQSLARARLVFLVLAFVLPAGCFGAFERQARHLDALGAHGAPATASVTGASRDYVDYAYVVDGTTQTWNVAREKAPYGVGERFPILYLPEDPSLSRPGTDGAVAIEEATSNRSVAWKTEAGLFAFFAANALLCDVRLRRLRKTGRTEHDDPRAYRTRLLLTGAMLAPVLLLISGWHLRDAAERGESTWPVVLAAMGSLAIVGGTVFYALREGSQHVAARPARLLHWAAPLAAGIAALRLLAWLIGK